MARKAKTAFILGKKALECQFVGRATTPDDRGKLIWNTAEKARAYLDRHADEDEAEYAVYEVRLNGSWAKCVGKPDSQGECELLGTVRVLRRVDPALTEKPWH